MCWDHTFYSYIVTIDTSNLIILVMLEIYAFHIYCDTTIYSAAMLTPGILATYTLTPYPPDVLRI